MKKNGDSLSQQMENIGFFAGRVAHDFNNILSALFAPISLIEHHLDSKKEISPDKIRSHLALLRQASEHAAAMTTLLNSISPRVSIVHAPLNLRELLEKTIRKNEEELDTSIKVNTKFRCEKPMIKADPSLFYQMLNQIIQNSIHAMTIMKAENEEWGGELLVTLQEADPEWVEGQDKPTKRYSLCIADDGVGIPQELGERIFLPYFSTKKKGEGKGLGLSIAYNICQQHQIDISVGAGAVSGTEVTLMIPALELEDKSQ